MPEHVWSVLCEKSSVDTSSNVLSLLCVIDAVSVKGPEPKARGVVPFEATLVTLWRRSEAATPEVFENRIVVVTPDGSEIPATEPATVDLRTHLRYRAFMKMEAMPFRGGGVYRFAVEYRSGPEQEWLRVPAALPLDVTFERVDQSAPTGRSKEPKLLVRRRL